MATKSKLQPNVCSASRCKQPTTDPEGRDTCPKHAVESTALSPLDQVQAAAKDVQEVQPHLLEALSDAAQIPLTEEIELPDGRVVLGLERLGEIDREAADLFKAAEERRKAITGPMLDAKRQVDDLFKPITQLAQKVMSLCKARAEEHARAQLVERQAALALLAANPEAPEADAAFATVHAPIQVASSQAVRSVLEYEVVDFSLLPDAFKQVNDAAIRAHLSATAGTVPVPGLEIRTTVKVVRA